MSKSKYPYMMFTEQGRTVVKSEQDEFATKLYFLIQEYDLIASGTMSFKKKFGEGKEFEVEYEQF